MPPTRCRCFNPLPSPKQGETRASKPLHLLAFSFQSAPLTKARGDMSQDEKEEVFILFQSAPLTKARGDMGWIDGDGDSMGFNPLPSPKQGETG